MERDSECISGLLREPLRVLLGAAGGPPGGYLGVLGVGLGGSEGAREGLRRALGRYLQEAEEKMKIRSR